jgi:hypothetical protein
VCLETAFRSGSLHRLALAFVRGNAMGKAVANGLLFGLVLRRSFTSGSEIDDVSHSFSLP